MTKLFNFFLVLTYICMGITVILFLLFVLAFFFGDAKDYLMLLLYFTGSLFITIHIGVSLLVSKACYLYIKKNEIVQKAISSKSDSEHANGQEAIQWKDPLQGYK